MHEGGTAERPALFFDGADEFRGWLDEHHATATELWMGLTKRHFVPRGLVWQDAVREALCYGWIDSQSQRLDDDAVRQRWTPRRPGSIWSKINVAAVEELIAEGRMTPAGLAAYEKRRDDRTGVYSFEAETSELPEPYQALIDADPRAALFWAQATAAYRKVATHWVVTAKQESTRDRRMGELVADSSAGRLIKTQRYGSEPAWVGRARARLDTTHV